MQNFAAIGPFGAEIWRGGQIDPPPSKNLLSKSPVKIGLRTLKLFKQKISRKVDGKAEKGVFSSGSYFIKIYGKIATI